ncbi:RNA-directed DNA polymerase [Agrobacterium rosae]|uniref:RNA-directed DNA polymerase n=1 Tax=Agrobacterium rosae TaxID=1972867 RepID=A0AAW9FI38_9HYPH|nr:RNA-directed DNA polymerase [Agrobacterium rosae]MDX8305331.1 RNA-directed DNA polymerase [Agrobacterium rosae]
MTVQLGNIEFDEDLIVKQLKIDFKDDWFPDPIGYTDFISAGLLPVIVRKNFERNDGAYSPSKAMLLNVPKGNFTLRYALETSFSDRAIYHSLAMHLLPFYDPTISRWVFSHRWGDSSGRERSDPKYVFRNGIQAWSDFLGCVQSAAKPGTYLLSTDLANYFENISLSTLKEIMLELVPLLDADDQAKEQVRVLVDQLFGYLTSWSFNGDRGLPQNRDASSFLANIYMRSVDQAMLDKGYNYFRYMDDVKIVCASEGAAKRALKELVLVLRPLGQVVNGGKTQIVASDNPEAIRLCLDLPSLEMKRIDTAWASKALNPISRTFVPLKRLALSVLEAGNFNSREFRFCINRLETLGRCSEFEVPATYFEDLTPLIIHGFDTSPVSTDQICRYLRAVPIGEGDYSTLESHLIDDERGIYNWKNYRLWVLLTQRGYRSSTLIEHARKIVSEHGDDPTRAGASLYLGAFGDLEDRELIALKFNELQSFLGQRTAIIAVQELHFRPAATREISINSHVRAHLRDDLKGTYTALKRTGVYSEKLEPVSITRYVERERDYD